MNNGLFPQDNSGIFHSSGYARVARGNTIGSMSVQPYGQRSYLERNRTSVRRYGESMMAQSYLDRGTGTVGADPTGISSRSSGYGMRSRGSLSSPSRVSAMPQRTFKEPPPRYNPFG